MPALDCCEPVVVALAGLPGVGKTTVARFVAARTGFAHLRIDTIEAALNASGLIPAAGGWQAFPDAGYRVACGIARDLLATGCSVITDSVNPIAQTRAEWARLARDSGAHLLNVEVVCSDVAEHRRRIESRAADRDGLVLPNWHQTQIRHYESWTEEVLRIDTSTGGDAAGTAIIAALRELKLLPEGNGAGRP